MPPLVLQSWCQNGSRLSLHAEMNHFSQPVICWLALKLVRPRSFRFLFVLNEMHSLICFATKKKKKNSRSMKVYDCNVSPDYHRYVLNLFKWKKALTKRIKPFWNSRFPKIISVAFRLYRSLCAKLKSSEYLTSFESGVNQFAFPYWQGLERGSLCLNNFIAGFCYSFVENVVCLRYDNQSCVRKLAKQGL